MYYFILLASELCRSFLYHNVRQLVGWVWNHVPHCPHNAHCTRFPSPPSCGVINASVINHIAGSQKVCTRFQKLNALQIFRNCSSIAPTTEQRNNLIQSPVNLMGPFLSKDVAESHILNAQGMHACHCWGAGERRRKGYLLSMGHQFDAASPLNNTNTSRSLYCGSPWEGEGRGAGGCSSSLALHGYF